jgi:hypothetical protein
MPRAEAKARNTGSVSGIPQSSSALDESHEFTVVTWTHTPASSSFLLIAVAEIEV